MKQYIEIILGFVGLIVICAMVLIDHCQDKYTTRVVHPVGNSTFYKVEIHNIFKPGDTIWYKSGNEQYRIVIVR